MTLVRSILVPTIYSLLRMDILGEPSRICRPVPYLQCPSPTSSVCPLDIRPRDTVIGWLRVPRIEFPILELYLEDESRPNTF